MRLFLCSLLLTVGCASVQTQTPAPPTAVAPQVLSVPLPATVTATAAPAVFVPSEILSDTVRSVIETLEKLDRLAVSGGLSREQMRTVLVLRISVLRALGHYWYSKLPNELQDLSDNISQKLFEEAVRSERSGI